MEGSHNVISNQLSPRLEHFLVNTQKEHTQDVPYSTQIMSFTPDVPLYRSAKIKSSAGIHVNDKFVIAMF